MGTADRENEPRHRILRHYALGLPDDKFDAMVEPVYRAEPADVQRKVKDDMRKIEHAKEGWGS